MNQILIETHKKQNIDLLRVRDLFFDKARKLYKFRTFSMVLPVILLVASYLPFISRITVLDMYRDYYIGVISIVLFFVTDLIDDKMQEYLEISNTFREQYDVNVFGIEQNKYIYDNALIAQYLPLADTSVHDSKKYEYWYEEIFCEEPLGNILCCQMDNIIYTYYVYRSTKKLYTAAVAAVAVLMVVLWIVVGTPSFLILSILSAFSVVQMFLEYIDVCSELIDNNQKLREKLLHGDEKVSEIDVRCIQDCIVTNRNRSLFIPKYIRDKFLKDGNPYYMDLNEVRKKLLPKETTTIPSKVEDIEILSSDGKRKTDLPTVHERLLAMLRDVREVFDKNGIQYTLDGGTLIGAIREGGHFIFWDDDVDLAIRYEDFARAKELLAESFGAIYDLQDYYNEEYYSPRLSSLRVREKGSVVCEKDSALYEKYGMRGLFLDIYVYAPVLCSLSFDKWYRKCFIHPMHRQIKKTEELWRSDREKYGARFIKEKARYMKRVEWYLAHAKCDAYYTYTPNYIENIKSPGPYFSKADLYGEKRVATFEGLEYPVPTNAEAVLVGFYGDTWNQSPFLSIADYEAKYGDDWYGHKRFAVTAMKHLSYLD